ncbi:MAG: PH domain-containing protein [Oscillatoria sp. SIO1A7]|nr:PH domain-containing protein [Oscillatoria sp. SIO1A7]
MGIKEEVYYNGGPHRGDLILNILLAFTIVALPLTAASIVRALWLRYRITDRRISVTSGWMGRDRVDVVYSQVAKVVTVPRGLGIWGDMVVTLKDGSRIEMRALPKFRDIYSYISSKLSADAREASGAIGK